MKTLVHLSVPSVSLRHDILLPADLLVGEAVGLLVEAVVELSAGRYASSGREVLCLAEGNILLRSGHSFAEYGLKNEDHLILL